MHVVASVCVLYISMYVIASLASFSPFKMEREKTQGDESKTKLVQIVCR